MQLFSSYSCFRVCVEPRSVCSACVMWRKWVIKSHDVHMITMCMYVRVCRFCTRGVPAVLWLSPTSRGRLLQGYVMEYSVLLPVLTSYILGKGDTLDIAHFFMVTVFTYNLSTSCMVHLMKRFIKLLVCVCALIGVLCGVLCREFQSHDV